MKKQVKVRPEIRARTAIVGAGPAGLLAAIAHGAGALLLERNPDAGRKLLVSGAGQCNFSNNLSREDFLRACGRAANFLKPFAGLASSLIAVPIPGAHERPFDPADLAALATSLGFRAEIAPDVPSALERIAKRRTGAHRILITGSLYLAGNVLAFDSGLAQQSN